MLGATRITQLLGSGVDNTDHDAMRAFVRAACGEGLSLLLCHPGSKIPADMRTPRQRNADDKIAQEAAREAGRRDWAKVKSPSGLALASSEAKVVLKYLDQYVATLSEWCDENGPVGYDAKRAKAGDIAISEPVAVNIAVEVGASALVVIDCDTAAQLTRWREVAEIGEDIPPTIASPGQIGDGDPADRATWVHADGGHFYFTVPDQLIPTLPRNMGAFTWGGDDGFAVLWDRRYVLIPPSTRPEGAYELVGRDYELPEWLYDEIVKRGNLRATRAEGQRHHGENETLSAAVDAWSETISWADILEPLGWVPAPRADGCGCPIWTAPGVHASPKSATAHDSGCSYGRYTETNAPLHIWTDNPGEPFDAYVEATGTTTLSKLQAVAYANYSGKIGAAMDELGLMPDLTIAGDTDVRPGDIGADEVSASSVGDDLPAIETVLDRMPPAQRQDALTDEPASMAVDGPEPDQDESPSTGWCAQCQDDVPAAELYKDADGGWWHRGLTGDNDDGSAEDHLAVLDDDDPYDDDVDSDPDLFESEIAGVPVIAPFSHWRDMPAPEYVIDGLIEHGGLSSMIGAPGTGKSTVALDMACHIAAGRAWQGRRVLKTRVLYLPGEGLAGAVQRLRAWEAAHEAAIGRDLLLGNSILQLGAPKEAWAEMAAYIARAGIGLIIFDTFARMSLQLEENSATDVGKAVRRFDQVRELTNAGVMVLHHTAKHSDISRGSSALNGALDSELLIRDATWDYADMGVDPATAPRGKRIELLTSKQKNAEQLDHPLPLIMMPSVHVTAPLITGPSGNLDPMVGDVVMARPVAEPVVETAIRLKAFAERHPAQGVTRGEFVSGVEPDGHIRSRADAVKAWRQKVNEAVDLGLRYELLETLTGKLSGARYVPGPMGIEAARQRHAGEVMNADGD